jgi:hypothetical protein
MVHVMDVTQSCGQKLGNWQCRDGFFVRDGAEDLEGMPKYPCPKCNTLTFLQEAKREAEDSGFVFGGCACCDPGPSGAEIWTGALRMARDHNTAATEAALPVIGRVKAFGQDGLKTFDYSNDAAVRAE